MMGLNQKLSVSSDMIFTCDEVRGRRSTDDIRPWKILEIVAVEA